MDSKDYSRNESDMSADNMRASTLGERHPIGRDYSAELPSSPGAAPDILSLFHATHARLSKVEADNAQMRREIEAAKNKGDIDFDYEHVNHVMTKYFPHDRPEVEPSEPPVARFDAFTGKPLAPPQRRFDEVTGQPLN